MKRDDVWSNIEAMTEYERLAAAVAEMNAQLAPGIMNREHISANRVAILERTEPLLQRMADLRSRYCVPGGGHDD